MADPVVNKRKALVPTAVLSEPDVKPFITQIPRATLLLPDSEADPAPSVPTPTATLLLALFAVAVAFMEFQPMATLLLAPVAEAIAFNPTAVLNSPVVSKRPASEPNAELPPPLVTAARAKRPKAELFPPVEDTTLIAPEPMAVLSMRPAAPRPTETLFTTMSFCVDNTPALLIWARITLPVTNDRSRAAPAVPVVPRKLPVGVAPRVPPFVVAEFPVIDHPCPAKRFACVIF